MGSLIIEVHFDGKMGFEIKIAIFAKKYVFDRDLGSNVISFEITTTYVTYLLSHKFGETFPLKAFSRKKCFGFDK